MLVETSQLQLGREDIKIMVLICACGNCDQPQFSSKLRLIMVFICDFGKREDPK